MITPLMFRDVVETMVENGIPKGTALMLGAALGWGVQNYDNRVHEPIDNKDNNWLYDNEITIPRMSEDATFGKILGVDAEAAKAVGLGDKLTEEQREELFKKTAPGVSDAIAAAREQMKVKVEDKDEAILYKAGVQKELEQTVRAERIKAAIEMSGIQ
jgi:hypothetical protein